MKESTKRHYHSIAYFLIGGFMIGIGGFLAIDAWSTMSQIEAQGVLGQAAYQNEYNSAVEMLQISGLGVLLGFVIVLNGLVEDLKTTLYKLNGE